MASQFKQLRRVFCRRTIGIAVVLPLCGALVAGCMEQHVVYDDSIQAQYGGQPLNGNYPEGSYSRFPPDAAFQGNGPPSEPIQPGQFIYGPVQNNQ
jgi:hypothetical protein